MSYLVLYRELGPSSDGRSRIFGLFASLLDAQSAMSGDVERYCNLLRSLELSLTVEEKPWMVSVKVGLDEYLCDWEILQLSM